MTRIDFYILQDVELSALHRFACRLAAKAMRQGHRAYLHAGDAAQAQEMDELLWCHPRQRLIPHGRVGEPAAQGAPVVIGGPKAGDGPFPSNDLLINLAEAPPAFFGQFERVAEIVVGERRASGRARYKHYRDLGYPLFHHELDRWEG